jgi:hypothetical protein
MKIPDGLVKIWERMRMPYPESIPVGTALNDDRISRREKKNAMKRLKELSR